MRVKLLLILVIVFNVSTIVIAQVNEIPKNLKFFDKKGGTMKFKVLKNPFFLYLDFAQLSEKCIRKGNGYKSEKKACICYHGFDGPFWSNIGLYTLTPLELDMYNKAGTLNGIELGPRMDPECKGFGVEEPFKSYMAECREENNSTKFRYLNAGYAGRRFGPQKICFEGVKKLDGKLVPFYELSVNSTGRGGSFGSKHIAYATRSGTEGYLKILFNTRQSVLQPFGGITGVPVQEKSFFITSQVGTYQAFTYDALIEETFITLFYEPCIEAVSYFLYDPTELTLVSDNGVFDHPSNVKGYIGSLLYSLDGETDPKNMEKRNRTEYDEILYQEMEYQKKVMGRLFTFDHDNHP